MPTLDKFVVLQGVKLDDLADEMNRLDRLGYEVNHDPSANYRQGDNIMCTVYGTLNPVKVAVQAGQGLVDHALDLGTFAIAQVKGKLATAMEEAEREIARIREELDAKDATAETPAPPAPAEGTTDEKTAE